MWNESLLRWEIRSLFVQSTIWEAMQAASPAKYQDCLYWKLFSWSRDVGEQCIARGRSSGKVRGLTKPQRDSRGGTQRIDVGRCPRPAVLGKTLCAAHLAQEE